MVTRSVIIALRILIRNWMMRHASIYSTNASQQWATLRQVHLKSLMYTVWIGRDHRTELNRRNYFEAGSAVLGELSGSPTSQRQGPHL